MITTALIRNFSNASSRTRIRIIALTACLLIVVTASFAHAFLNFDGRIIRYSTNAQRSDSRSLASQTVSGSIYVFTSRTDIKEISYYINPEGNLDSRFLYGRRTVAPFDLAGTDSAGKPYGLPTSSLKNGLNLIISKITFKDGGVTHDFTWFTTSNTAVTVSPTTNTTTTTKGSTTTPTTTRPVTTTTAGHGNHDPILDANCTIGQLASMGPCINRSLIPAPAVGFNDLRLVPSGPPRSGSGEPGAFRTRCEFSHMNNDDSILRPNQPASTHLHSYFGNTGANARSTSQSLLTSGNSTCSGGILNRSAYWVPSMVDTRTGRPIRPSDDRGRYQSDLEIYYKLGYQGVGYGDVRPFPNGLQIIAGNAATATGPTNDTKVHYGCETSDPANRVAHDAWRNAIPNCTQGQILVMSIRFPQCWDGVNLRAPDGTGRSHMAYGQWVGGYPSTSVGCPSTHPVGLPFIEMFVRYTVRAGDNVSNWKLSSDNYTNGPGGYSGHADYIFAWQENTFQTIVNNCYRTRLECDYSLGDRREPQHPRF